MKKQEKITELICEHCGLDLCDPDAICEQNICPILDEFSLVCSLEMANKHSKKAPKTARNRNPIQSTAGGPAPSDTPISIRHT